MASSSLRSLEYLETMPGAAFTRLYQQPSTVLAVFRRMLTHLAKTFVMSMLFIGRPVAISDLDSWVKPGCRKEKHQAINLLERLRILKSIANPGKPRGYDLTLPFKGSLQKALTGGRGDHGSFGIPCKTPAKDPPSVEQLDFYARKQWDGILGYMVGRTEGTTISAQATTVPDSIKKLLMKANLVTDRSRNPTITQDGFAFVLQDVNAQVWTILISYLGAAPEMNMDEVEVLSFLFMLGGLELGQDYSKANLTATQTHMLEDLTDFGLIYQTSFSSSRFYPTRLATTLTSDASALAHSATFASSGVRAHNGSGSSLRANEESQGFILVETNYRLYAYTSSPLQIAILQLFARIAVRYPNMVAGKITRDSIRKAVSIGITADQVISFLNTHAHPQMRKSTPVLPPTVVDQIKLWQIENERMQATPGFLLKDFDTQEAYKTACQYARDIAVLAWFSDEKRMFFVTRVEQMVAYLKKPKVLNASTTAGAGASNNGR